MDRGEAERSEALLLLSSAVCRLCTRPPLCGAVSLPPLSLCFYPSVHLSISTEHHMRHLRFVALHVETSAGESESFRLMRCGVRVSQERAYGWGP